MDDNPTTILMVEDERELVPPLKMLLERRGFKVLVANNGSEGLTLARAENPALIVLDIVMPVMDGKTMLNKLWQEKWSRKIPVIVLTNLCDVKNEFGSNKHISEYLVKSNVSMIDLVAKIEGIVGKPQEKK